MYLIEGLFHETKWIHAFKQCDKWFHFLYHQYYLASYISPVVTIILHENVNRIYF